MTFDVGSQDAPYKMHEWRPKVVNGVAHDDRPILLNTVSAASLAGKDVPEQPWLVKDWIPDHNVTLLYGDGGTGKSLLALQLAVAVATGSDWIGTIPEYGPVLYLSAEDDLNEIHRRLNKIITAQSRKFEELEELHLEDLAGKDAVMGAPSKGGGIEATALWAAILEKIEQLRPRLVVIDTQADAFSGNEIVRVEARQFIGLLRAAALKYELSVVLLAHPSVDGMRSGSGTSGSTGWSNSVRSRLYLDRIKDGDGDSEPDPDLRVLRLMKTNHAKIGAEIRVRWLEGCFKPEGGGLNPIDRAAADSQAEAKFLELLDLLTDQGRNVSHQPGPTYAPTVFNDHPNSSGVKKRAFVRAMEALLDRKTIRVRESGSPSRRRTNLVREA